jgi:Resolvase, N terminal domain/Recombinase zinc beta ribbon domain
MTSENTGSFDALLEWLATITTRGQTPVIIVGRISQDPDYTLSAVERHIRGCLVRVAEHPEWELVPVRGSVKDPSDPGAGYWPDGVLVDNNVSASKTTRLTEHHRAMALADAGLVKVIVSYNQARLWRERTLRADGFARLGKAKVRLDSVMGPSLDLSKATERMLAGIIGEADEWYLEITKEAQRAVALDHAKAGAWHGKRPFGFTLVRAPGPKQGDKRSLVLKEAEAAPLREVYARVDPALPAGLPRFRGDEPREEGQRWTLWDACAWLDAQGVPTTTGMTWAQAGTGSLSTVLCAARNIGLREHAEGWVGSGHRPYAKRGDPSLHKALWVPLLDDDELFWRVREALTSGERRRPGPKVTARHMLTGSVWCGRCGGPMYVQHNRSKPSWTCQRCWTVRGEAQVTAEAERAIFAWLSGNSPFDRAMAAAEPADLAAKRTRVAKLREARSKITETDKARQLARKDEQIAGIETALVSYDERLSSLGVTARGDEFAALWQEWSGAGEHGMAEQYRIAKLLISRVVIYPAGRTNDPSPELISVEPGAWAARLADPAEVAPAVAPDPASLTSRGKALAVLREARGDWLSPDEIATAAGLHPGSAKHLLRRMAADGAVERQRLPYGTAVANGIMTVEEARTASASKSLRGAGCHGFRITGGTDGADPGVDRPAT